MECPRCGYVLDAFATECPKCVRLKQQNAMFEDGAAPVPTAHMPTPTATRPAATAPATQPPAAASPPVNQPTGTMAPNLTGRAVNTMRGMRPEPLIHTGDGPVLGWPLTITLWVLLVLNSVVLVFFVIGGVAVHSLMEQSAEARVVNGVLFLGMIAMGLRVASLIALLRYQRWGFYTFLLFVAGPAVLSLINYQHSNPIELAFNVLQGVIVVVLVLMKWDELD